MIWTIPAVSSIRGTSSASQVATSKVRRPEGAGDHALLTHLTFLSVASISLPGTSDVYGWVYASTTLPGLTTYASQSPLAIDCGPPFG
jgi:hypothetical protein